MEEIKITSIAAFRVAVTLASAKDYLREFRCVVLEAGGRLIASNGFELVVSNNAHNAKETTYLLFHTPPRILKYTSLITIKDDILTEHAGKTTKLHPVEVSTEGIHNDPDALIASLTGSELKAPKAPFDSIKGGKLATAYGLESPRGIWLPTCNPSIMYLGDARDDDLVILATLQEDRSPVNRFPLKQAAAPAPTSN